MMNEKDNNDLYFFTVNKIQLDYKSNRPYIIEVIHH